MTRRAILVLGMHRSGTSALAGLLVHLGVQGPRTLMPATEYNERGYWESTPFQEYHEGLLKEAGTEWDLWTSVPPNGLDPERTTVLGAEFRTLLDQEFGDAPLFVLKDPRVCRLLPFWQAQLLAAGVEPLAVIIVRSPLEVAASLAARDGLALDHALLLWLRHVLDAEAGTRGVGRSFVRYQDLLAGWGAVAQRLARDLGLQWPERSAEADARITAFLGPDLRHHVDRGEAPAVPPLLADWIARTMEALDGLLDGDSRSAEMLDQVRREFDRSAAVFGPSVESERRAHRRQVAAADERARALAIVEGQLDQARRYQAALLADVDDLRRHRDAVIQELATARQQLSATVDVVSARLETSDRRIHELEQSRTWRWSRPIRVVAQLMQDAAARFRR